MSIREKGQSASEVTEQAITDAMTDAAHGTRGGGALHADATGSVDGFMSAADKTKHDDVALGNITVPMRNESGAEIPKGKAVAVSGWSVAHSRPLVVLGDLTDSNKRPARAVTRAAVPDGTNFDGLVAGELSGVDTSSFAVSDQLILGTAGNLVKPPPDNPGITTGEVQNIGVVERVDASVGVVSIFIDGLLPVTVEQILVLPNVIASGAVNPNRSTLGALLDYPAQGTFGGASTIQYVQAYLVEGIQLVTMETWIEQGAGPGEDIRMGVFDQSDPVDRLGEPNNKIAETAIRNVTGADDGTLVAVSLVSPTTIATTGYYWLALVSDGTANKFAVTADVYRAGFLPRREESTTGVTLPSTAGSLTNPASAVAYVAAVRL